MGSGNSKDVGIPEREIMFTILPCFAGGLGDYVFYDTHGYDSLRFFCITHPPYHSSSLLSFLTPTLTRPTTNEGHTAILLLYYPFFRSLYAMLRNPPDV